MFTVLFVIHGFFYSWIFLFTDFFIKGFFLLTDFLAKLFIHVRIFYGRCFFWLQFSPFFGYKYDLGHLGANLSLGLKPRQDSNLSLA